MKKFLVLILICAATAAGAAGVITPHWSGAIIDNLVVKESPYVDVRAYDGADLGAKFNAAVAALGTQGGTIVIPPGDYTTATELQLYNNVPTVVWAYGARVYTTGAISGLHIKSVYSGATYRSDASFGATVYGLEIMHDNNSTALYGINNEGRVAFNLVDVYVCADNVTRSGYAAVRYCEDVTNGANGTGAMEGVIERLKLTGYSGNMDIGVLIESWSNGVKILNGRLDHTDNAIQIQVQSDGSIADYVANGIVVNGNSFNSGANAISVIGGATSHIEGLSITNNRVEPGAGTDYVLNLSGISNRSLFAPPFFAGNYILTVTALVNDPNSIGVRSLDHMDTPGYTGTGNVGGLALTGVISISGATAASSYNYPASNNLRGAATFDNAATVAVAFTDNELTASYYVTLGCSADARYWVTGKAFGGFTINSSDNASVAICDWMLFH